MNKEIKKVSVKKDVPKYKSDDVVICDKCGVKIFFNKGKCKYCGQHLKKVKIIKE